MVNWVLTIVSGVFSCFIAILATVGVEKLGGKLGGVLATTPTTIIPFCIGLVLADNSQADIDSSLFAVPPTIALTALYLLAWREFPCIPFIAAMEKRKPLQGLLMVLLLSMTMWFCGAALLYFALPAAAANGVPVQATGFIGLVMNFTVGICGLVFRNRPAPGGKLPVTWLTYASRGLLAGTAISISIILSTISPTLGGIMSAFPANTSTAMISLWWSQGLAVSQGSATSMACGNLAVSSYAIMFAMIWPHIYRNDVPLVFALIVVSVLCWTLAAFFVSIPMFSLVQTFKPDAKFAHLDESDLKPLSETLVEMSEDSSKESEVPGSPEGTSKNVV